MAKGELSLKYFNSQIDTGNDWHRCKNKKIRSFKSLPLQVASDIGSDLPKALTHIDTLGRLEWVELWDSPCRAFSLTALRGEGCSFCAT